MTGKLTEEEITRLLNYWIKSAKEYTNEWFKRCKEIYVWLKKELKKK